MGKVVTTGRSFFQGVAEGEAIVSQSLVHISGAGLDRKKGIIHWKGHELDGVCLKDRVLVMPRALGSSGGDWGLYAMKTVYNSAPSAIVCSEVDSFTAAGSLLGKIPLIDRVETDPTELIETGDTVRIDGEKGIIEIVKKKETTGVGAQELEKVETGQKTPPAQKPTLSPEEEEMLSGHQGEGVQKCMEFLVSYGKAFDAKRMVELGGVHVAACSYRLGGEGALRFLARLADTNSQVKVAATLNPISIDLRRWQSVMRLPEELQEKTLIMNTAFEKLGFVPLFTCTPYWTNVAPKLGQHVVWGEHNAACYVNTVWGAMTNFEAHLTAIPAAITGKFPEYGLHIKANRKAQAIVRVETELKTPPDWRCLGLYAAKNLVEKIPLFTGLPETISNRQFRDLTSSMGPPYGSVPMAHVLGITPEALDMKSAFQGEPSADVETLVVGRKELDEVYAMFNSEIAEELDLVTLGCPFYCIEDLKEAASLLRGRRVHPKVQLWIWTDEATKSVAGRMGLVRDIEEAGGFVLTDTCSVCCPMDQCAHGFKNTMTDSVKESGFYLRSRTFTSSVGTMEECIEAAIAGRRER